MTRKLRRTIILLLVIALGGALAWYYTRPAPVPVTLWKIARGTVEATVANTRAGTISACQRAKLAPAAPGQVASLPIKEGERVQGGQVLLEIWNEDLKANLRLAESDAAAARSRAEEACLAGELAERDAQRQLQLQKKGLVSEDTVDRAVSTARGRAAACRATRSAVQVAADRIAVARAQLERTILRAPFAGVVAEINTELGEYVTPSPPGIPTLPAVDLIDDSCLYVTAPIDEVDAAAIRPGMPARVSLDALPGRHFKGEVRRVAPYVLEREKQARTVDVEVLFENPKETQHLLVGYSADVEIVLHNQRNALRVPTEAVLQGSRVLVYSPDSRRIEERDIKTGISNWEFTEVESGLREGDLVVVSVQREGVQPGTYAIPDGPARGGNG